MKRAVFLDRDGTINQDVGDLFEIERVEFIPGALEALRMLAGRFNLFIITNQSGIGKGVFCLEQYRSFEREYTAFLKREGIDILQTYCCPHRKDQPCLCRKPSTHFITVAAGKYGLDLPRSFTIGDHPHDVEMGLMAGSKAVYLLTGHGAKHRGELVTRPHHIAEDLAAAARWIHAME